VKNCHLSIIMIEIETWSEWDRYCDRPIYLIYQNGVNNTYRSGLDLEGFEVVHVNIVVRHGARTPLNESTCWTNSFNQENKELAKIWSVPNHSVDKYFNEVYDVDGSEEESEWGQLLAKGKEQEELNGRIVADRYLNTKTNQSQMDVYIRHTSTERTKISAIHFAIGLISAYEQQKMRENKFDPINPKVQNLHTALKGHDKLLTNRCPRVKALEKEMKASKDYTDIKALFKDVEALFVDKVSDLNQDRNPNQKIRWSYDSMDCILAHYCIRGTRSDPIFTSREILKIFEGLKEEELLPFSWRDGLISKRAMADYLHDMLDRVDHHLIEPIKTPNPSAYISLAHDSTIAFLLGALSDGRLVRASPYKSVLELVPYAAMLAFEFVKSLESKEMYIRVYYLESNITKWVTGCDGLDLCLYDSFKKSFEKWSIELPPCQMSDPQTVIIDC